MSDETTTNGAAEETPAETYLPMRTTAEAEGTIGGESHDSYAFFAVRGQRLTVRISWDKHEEFEDNNAGCSISYGGETFTDDSGVFQTTGAERESTTTGKVPRTGDYHLFVVAHPVADYRLRVTLE